jgi:hypothetical protein
MPDILLLRHYWKHGIRLFSGLAIATLAFAGATPIFARATQAQIMATQEMYFHKFLQKYFLCALVKFWLTLSRKLTAFRKRTPIYSSRQASGKVIEHGDQGMDKPAHSFKMLYRCLLLYPSPM